MATTDTEDRYQVIDVEVDRMNEMRIRFADGVNARFDLLNLRKGCPCAGCRGHREAGRSSFAGTEITIADAELHGAWGISLRWSDGHSTGIYAWSYLRDWCDAGVDSIP